jgi:hypothetical protein
VDASGCDINDQELLAKQRVESWDVTIDQRLKEGRIGTKDRFAERRG